MQQQPTPLCSNKGAHTHECTAQNHMHTPPPDKHKHRHYSTVVVQVITANADKEYGNNNTYVYTIVVQQVCRALSYEHLGVLYLNRLKISQYLEYTSGGMFPNGTRSTCVDRWESNPCFTHTRVFGMVGPLSAASTASVKMKRGEWAAKVKAKDVVFCGGTSKPCKVLQVASRVAPGLYFRLSRPASGRRRYQTHCHWHRRYRSYGHCSGEETCLWRLMKKSQVKISARCKSTGGVAVFLIVFFCWTRTCTREKREQSWGWSIRPTCTALLCFSVRMFVAWRCSGAHFKAHSWNRVVYLQIFQC